MDRHLRGGCAQCVAAFDAWQGLAVFAREEREITPPENVVRVAKSFLAQRKFADPVPGARPIVAWASAQLATLVFDSRLSVPAGVRANATAFSRHLVFGARSLVVDLHIDTAPRAGWFLLAGQIVDRNAPDKPLENVWLSLVDDRQEMASFRTNELGEFRCTFDFRRTLKLMVYAGRDVIAIPMETLFDPSSDPNPKH